jgi:hypothetical protein
MQQDAKIQYYTGYLLTNLIKHCIVLLLLHVAVTTFQVNPLSRDLNNRLLSETLLSVTVEPEHGTRCLASNTLLFVHICLATSAVSVCFNTKGAALLDVKTRTPTCTHI